MAVGSRTRMSFASAIIRRSIDVDRSVGLFVDESNGRGMEDGRGHIVLD